MPDQGRPDAWRGHTLVVGRTGSGKTHHVVNVMVPELQRRGRGVLFFNGGQEVKKLERMGEVEANLKDNVRSIAEWVSRGGALWYTPCLKTRLALEELKVLWGEIQAGRMGGIGFVVDEAQRYAWQGSVDTPLHVMATGGRRYDVECVFVTQRAADLSKTVATQCALWRIFRHSSIDAQYLRERGVVLTPEQEEKLASVPYAYVDVEA